MTNRGLLLFVIVFFVINSIVSYFLFYEKDIISTLSVSAVSSFFLFLIFIVKRKWDIKQKNDFKIK